MIIEMVDHSNSMPPDQVQKENMRKLGVENPHLKSFLEDRVKSGASYS
jgi:hypothetical protein